MERFITRQPLFLLEEHGYREQSLPDWRDSVYFELTAAGKLMLLPNGCRLFLWNMQRETLCCLDGSNGSVLDMEGDKLLGIQVSYRYQCQYDRERLAIWMKGISGYSSFAERARRCGRAGRVLEVKEVHPLINYAFDQMEKTEGRAEVEAIAAEYGYTARHMERLFRQTFSCGPKRFCRYLRLLDVTAKLVQGRGMEVAAWMENAGYSDRSHFQREFKAFTGITPRQFLTEYVDMTDALCSRAKASPK